MVNVRHVIHGPANDLGQRPVIADHTLAVPDAHTAVGFEFISPDCRPYLITVSVDETVEPVMNSKVRIGITEDDMGDWRVDCSGITGRLDYTATFTTRDLAFDNAVQHIQRRHVQWLI